MAQPGWVRLQSRRSCGGIWQVLAAVSVKEAKPGEINVWTVLGNRPGGMWQELSSETIVLSGRASADVWQQLNDETLIIRPRVNQWSALLLLPVDRSNRLGFWQVIGDETLVLSAPQHNPWSGLVAQREFTQQQPQRRLGWALKQLTTTGGERYYVLKNIRQGTYLRLTELQAFVWNLLDGEHTVQDIAIACFTEFKSLDVQGLLAFLGQLETRGFLVKTNVNLYRRMASSLQTDRTAQTINNFRKLLTGLSFSIPTFDRIATRVYQSGGFILFTWPAKLLILVITILGLGSLAYLTRTGEYTYIRGGSTTLGMGLLGLYIGQVLALLVHELAHILVCKSYGREVRRVGVMLYLFMPYLFVDTTDIWMERRRARLQTSWAGPYSGFFLAGFTSLCILFSHNHALNGILYQFAVSNALLSFANLNPLMTLDGYYMLMDWVEIPMLRAKALRFLQVDLQKRLSAKQRFNRQELFFASYGGISLAWIMVSIFGSVILIAQNFLRSIISYLGPTLAYSLSALLVCMLAYLLAWPLVGGFIRRQSTPRAPGAASYGLLIIFSLLFIL